MSRPLREVARECKIPESTLRGWKRKWEDDGVLPIAKKRAMGGGAKPILPQTKEEELLVRSKAREIWPVEKFKATHCWYKRFEKRQKLTTRTQTFWQVIIQLRTTYNIDPERIYNMDETPVNFDNVPKRIVDLRGIKRPVVFTTGSEKKRCTVVLACRADGRLLPPMVIFKGKKQNHKSIRTIVRSRGTVVMVQPKAWMD